MKRVTFCAVALAITSAGHSMARAAPLPDRVMLKLSPETRLEQRCDARAMGVVRREHKG